MVAVVVGLVLAGGRGTVLEPFGPDNPEAGGLQAIERVLVQEGVDVTVVRGVPALLETAVDEQTTVAVVGTAYLSEESGSRLVEHAAGSASLLVLDPSPGAGAALGLPLTVSPRSSSAALSAECDLPAARSGELVSGAGALLEVTSSGAPATVCFPPSASFNAGGSRSGHLVHFDREDSRPDTTVVGLAAGFTNGQVLQDANAALGLRLLGEQPRLVWFVPVVEDAMGTAPQGLMDVLPPATWPSIVLLGLAMFAVMLWRGRRLGRVVTEPLPAVVRSIETTQSRSRMYHRAGDRRRALASLQLAARRHWALRLGLPPATPTEVVVRAVAEATGRHTDQIHRLLADPAAHDDETLLQVARDARDLEEGWDRR